MFCGNSYSDEYTECTVKATLTNGKVLTASVRGYDDTGIYVRSVIDNFKKTYIKDDMTEYEKLEKVAWYLSAEYDYELYQDDWIRYLVTGSGDKVYMVITGFDESKPREYMIYEISRETFDKLNGENKIDPEYMWGE